MDADHINVARAPKKRSSRRPARATALPAIERKRQAHYHHGTLRRALIDAALRTAATHGADAISLRMLARAVGVSPNAPYNHFENIGALLAAVAEEGLNLLYEAMIAARDKTSSAGAQLEAIGVAYVMFAVEHQGYFRLFTAKEIGKKTSYPTLADAYRRTFGVVVEAIETCQKEGLVQSGPPRKLGLAAWSMVHGLATLIVEDQLAAADAANWHDEGEDKLTSSVLRVLFRGLKA